MKVDAKRNSAHDLIVYCKKWAVFHSRYEPMMQAFMRERILPLDADDIIQETFVALAKALPHDVYNPKENGYFHYIADCFCRI